MARWIASTPKGTTLGHFFSKPDMLARMPKKLRIGERFNVTSTRGAHLAFEVAVKGSVKVAVKIAERTLRPEECPPPPRPSPPGQLSLF